MTSKKSEFPDDKTKTERRRNLSPKELKDLELAGGVEGGMQAGSAGGPSEKDSGPHSGGASSATTKPEKEQG